jgi:2-phosphosulfolactate phosphatase
MMAENLWLQHRGDLPTFVQKTTHWHRLSAYGLEKDLLYCISSDVANVLPRYKNGELLVHQ